MFLAGLFHHFFDLKHVIKVVLNDLLFTTLHTFIVFFSGSSCKSKSRTGINPAKEESSMVSERGEGLDLIETMTSDVDVKAMVKQTLSAASHTLSHPIHGNKKVQSPTVNGTGIKDEPQTPALEQFNRYNAKLSSICDPKRDMLSKRIVERTQIGLQVKFPVLKSNFNGPQPKDIVASVNTALFG